MKAQANKTEKEIDDLLKRIKQKTGLTQEQIAKRIDYNRAYLSQAKKTDSEKLYNALQKEFKTELENLTSPPLPPTVERVKLEDIDFNQPAWQIVVNLSYIGQKNADSIDKFAASVDKMAAANQRNTEIIAALVGAMLPNSRFAAQLAASLAGSHENGSDDVPPLEILLGKEGIETLKQQLQGGKKAGDNKNNNSLSGKRGS